jgi:hypothetical protein
METEMHNNMADFEAWRQHREEIGRQVEADRLGRQLRAARPQKNPLSILARALGRRASGAPQAAR